MSGIERPSWNQRLLRRLCPTCAGKGCPGCLETGYRGRLPLLESLRIHDALRRRLAARDLEDVAAHPSLSERAAEMVAATLTNQREVERVLGIQ